MSHPKLFVFDIDGVLVESAKANYLSLNSAVKEVFGFDVPYELELLMGSIPSSKKIEIILAAFNTKASAEELASFKKKKFEYLLEYFELVEFNPNVREVFESLKRTGAKIAMVSNARNEYVELIIERLGVKHLVDFYVGSDCGLKAKPNPAMYLYAMAKLGESPKETIIFEDSNVGIAAARSSGARVYEIGSYLDLNLKLIASL